MDFLEYPDISMEHRGTLVNGRLKLTDNDIIFKASSGGTKSGKGGDTVEKDKIEIVNWQRLAGSWGIRIFTTDGKLHRFAGFRDSDREKLARFFTQTYNKDMLDRELSVKGWNWGTANFTGNVLSFEVGKADAFEIPLPNVQQCIAGKNEVALEFHPNDDAAVNLSEIRFHIPGSENAGEGDPVEAFKEQVMKNASVMTTSGDAIAIFREISCLSPRGRYYIKIFPSYIHLHGKTFDYKIPATSMVRLFLLPHKDGRQMHFSVNCDPPIKQGQTRYHYLVFIFKEEEEEDIEVPLSEEEIKDKYDGKLEKEMSGKTYELISKLFKAITGRKITLPGSFIGHSGTAAITCSHKAASGFLYPLERGIKFIYKPPIYLRYDEMQSVEFERTGGSLRSFDLKVVTVHDIEYMFSSIEKGEYNRLYDYLKAKKIKVTTSGKVVEGGALTWDDDGGDDKIDHHLAKVKKDAEEFTSGSDDMSSDDTDFNPDALEALSAKEEYDSEPSTTSDESESESEDDPEGDGLDGPEAARRREEKQKRRQEQREEKKAAKEKKKLKKAQKGSSLTTSGGGDRKEQRKHKKTKLPGQPKRYLSAYFLWMNENREKIKADNPGISITEVGKKAGEIWKALEDKSEWEEKAAEDRQRYDKELEEWKASGGAEAMAAAKKEAKKAKRASTNTTASEGGGSKSSKKPSTESTTTVAAAASSAGSGGNFKSKEFIDDSDSSSN